MSDLIFSYQADNEITEYIEVYKIEYHELSTYQLVIRDVETFPKSKPITFMEILATGDTIPYLFQVALESDIEIMDKRDIVNAEANYYATHPAEFDSFSRDYLLLSYDYYTALADMWHKASEGLYND